jgi:hypothetical protein
MIDDVARGQTGHDGSAIGTKDDQSLRVEYLERIADWHAADTEPESDLRGLQAMSGRKLPAENFPSQEIADLLPRRGPLDCIQFKLTAFERAR